MYNELTNLLPPERKRALSWDYRLRVSVVAVMLMTALTLAAAVLLLPTYVLLSGNANAKKEHLAGITSTFTSAEEAVLSARLVSLASNAAALATLLKSPSISATIRDVLVVGRPGITLSGFSYIPPSGKSSGTLTVSGTSKTRDALRNYQLALQVAPFVQSASLPVSAYAKDTDIAFVVTVTLSP
jgi:hypothetical protein